MAKFEGQERRMPKIEACLKEYGFSNIDETAEFCKSKGTYGRFADAVKYIDPRKE